ncbi:MAG: RHS repeat-associated core domain-containing protein, partial [Bacteroidales bacterium]|nr:RHS repeat-associated core domain-containing protein [Bacteroidales bacterium]
RQSVTQRKTTATTTYNHDYQSRLSQVTTSDGKTVTVDNFPDGFSRLAKTTEAGTTSYFHDGMSVLSEYDASGTRTARYTLGIGMDEIIARKDADGTFFYHYDGLGSVTAITDSTGKVMARYDYEPFGRMKEATGATINNPYTYTGREWDRETGLYFYRARYYDPMEGRFVSKDPIGFKGGINLYAYVGNRPTTKNDPYGLKYDSYGEWEAQFIIGYGQAYVTCCDGCTLWKHKYRKVCFGAGFVGGVSSGASLYDVPNGCKNPPKHIIAPQGGFGIYGPLGIEGGFSFDVEGDADSPYIGGSGGTGFKATVCYYWLSESKEMGGCSK